MINEIQPKIKFQNIVQCPFKLMKTSASEWTIRLQKRIIWYEFDTLAGVDENLHDTIAK